MRGEGPAPEVMNRETKHNHLEGDSLLSAGLTPGVEHVAAIVEVMQVDLVVRMALKYSNMLRSSPQQVSILSPSQWQVATHSDCNKLRDAYHVEQRHAQ